MFKDVRILAGVNISVLFFYSIAAMFIVPQFEKLFEGFGTDLPYATKLVIDSYHYWWLVPLIMVGQFLYMQFGNVNSVAAQRVFFSLNIFFVVLEVLFVPLMVIVFYLPIFAMGKVVAG